VSNAKRPTLQKANTRTSKAKQDAALDLGMTLTLDGKDYTVRTGDLTALDARELRRQVGMSFPQVIAGALSDATDIDILAAIIWLARYVNGERALTYEDVAGEIGYDVLDKFEVKEAGSAEDESSPEA
jgi:hypothetical protein